MTAATIAAPQQTVRTPRDIYGRELRAGDNIVYATRRGSSTYLNKLFIQSVTAYAIKGHAPDDVHERTRTLTSFDTVAKVY